MPVACHAASIDASYRLSSAALVAGMTTLVSQRRRFVTIELVTVSSGRSKVGTDASGTPAN